MNHLGLLYISDDEYLRSIPGMVESIQAARLEPMEQGKGLEDPIGDISACVHEPSSER